MSLLLSGVVLSLSLATAPAELAPGATLADALGLQVEAGSRYGLGGAPPGPRGKLPNAPAENGEHFLITYADDGSPARWQRFIVTGGSAGESTLLLHIDRQPPALTLRVDGALQRGDALYAGPAARLRIEASDPSGLGDGPQLSIDGAAVDDPQNIRWPDSDQLLRIQAEGSDALGNRGVSETLTLHFDRTPPELQAERVDELPGVAPDIVAPGEAIRLQLSDAGSGLASLQLGDTQLDLAGDATQVVALEMPTSTGYTLGDRLGNTRIAELPLRLDDAPPQLQLVSDGQAQIASNGARLPRSERLDLVALDALSGVDRACVELSIWYGDCRALPLSLVGIDPGRYRLVFRASDRLGHKAYERLEIEVLP